MSRTQYPTYEDPRDEGRLADLVSAGMWTTAGLVGAAMFALPGSTHEHLLEGLAVAGAAVLWGAISLVLYLTRATMSLRSRAVVTATTAPLVAAIARADFPSGIPTVRASFAWAVGPADGQSGQVLLDRADQRLLYRKRLNKQAI
jgi:hypothetical protein